MLIDHHIITTMLTKAGDILLSYFGKATATISLKSHNDILHEANTKSHEFITSQLQQYFPESSILSEEGTAGSEHSEHLFILDPLDGTINFSRGIPEFGISLAYQRQGTTISGWVYKPIQKNLYHASIGKGAWLDKQRLSVSTVLDMSHALVALDPAREDGTFPSFTNTLFSQIRAFRSYGCAIQALGLIAEGKLDAYIYTKTKIWDVAAMNLIIEEAGGCVRDHEGNPWQMGKPILVTTPSLVKQLITLLNTPA